MNEITAVAAGPSLTLFPPRNETRRTICVIGVPGGGAGFVAAVLRTLGVFMGSDLADGANEDRCFLGHERRPEIFQDAANAEAKARYLNDISEVIKERNHAYETWGWRDPLVAHYLTDIVGQLRNPAFILVTRDIGAVAQRLRIDRDTVARRALLSHLKGAAKAYESIIDLLTYRARPTLLVSYERALRAPGETGRAIAGFLGISEPDGFDEWLQGVIVAEGPVNRVSGISRQFGSTPAMRALLRESLRPRDGGFLAASVAAEKDRFVAANRLYEAAVTLLNSGDYHAAQDHALSIINLHASEFPTLFDGAAGVLADLSFGPGPETIHPDVVCGAFYLLGLAHLLSGEGQRALICLRVAEATMRRRLELCVPDSILSSANYWSCVFHVGVAAKAIARSDLVVRARGKIFSATSPVASSDFARLGMAGLIEARRRAEAEL